MLNTIIVVVVCVGSVIIVAVLGYVVAHAHDGEQRRHAESSDAAAAATDADPLLDDPLRGAPGPDGTAPQPEQPDTEER